MIHGFFDDSKSFGKSGFICLCGYLSDDSRWESFDADWRLLLQRHNIARLHTSDFLSAGGEYKNLREKTTPVERVQIVQQFIPVIQKYVLCGIAIGVDSLGFREMFAGVQKRPAPEEFCYYRAIRRTTLRCASPEWIARSIRSIPISLIFDDSDEHSMRFYGAHRKLRQRNPGIRDSVCGITFADDRFFSPLQAADLLACATAQEMRKGEGAWSAESPFVDLLRAEDSLYGLLYEQEYWDAGALAAKRAEIVNGGW